jgi:hypothetical protein
MIQVLVDTSGADAFLRAVERQIPFAAANALNRTAEEAQEAQRRGMSERFVIRKPWVLQRVKIERGDRATKDRLEVTVSVDEKGRFLRKFEEGGEKVALDRNFPIAIPTEEIRPTPQALVPLAYYPKNLRLVARRDVKGVLAAKTRVGPSGVTQWLGKRRTFILDPTQHRGAKVWGIFEREGPNDIRLIWVLKQRIKIPRRLEFIPTILDAVQRRWADNFVGFMVHALRTAK